MLRERLDSRCWERDWTPGVEGEIGLQVLRERLDSRCWGRDWTTKMVSVAYDHCTVWSQILLLRRVKLLILVLPSWRNGTKYYRPYRPYIFNSPWNVMVQITLFVFLCVPSIYLPRIRRDSREMNSEKEKWKKCPKWAITVILNNRNNDLWLYEYSFLKVYPSRPC